jgi:hypothetical protein
MSAGFSMPRNSRKLYLEILAVWRAQDRHAEPRPIGFRRTGGIANFHGDRGSSGDFRFAADDQSAVSKSSGRLIRSPVGTDKLEGLHMNKQSALLAMVVYAVTSFAPHGLETLVPLAHDAVISSANAAVDSETASLWSSLIDMASRRGTRDEQLDPAICRGFGLIDKNPQCKFMDISISNDNGESIGFGVFKEPGTGRVYCLSGNRDRQKGHFYLSSADGTLLQALYAEAGKGFSPVPKGDAPKSFTEHVLLLKSHLQDFVDAYGH